MPETVAETTEEQEEPTPLVPETDEELNEQEREEEPEPDESEPDEPAAPEPESAHDEAWWEKAWKASEKENERHASRVQAIFEEEAQAFQQCPMCLIGPAGWLTTTEFHDEHAALVKQTLGLHTPDEYQPMKGAAKCEDCDGLGIVRTFSRVPEHATIMCPRCSGTGWNHTPPGGVQTPAPAYVPPTPVVPSPEQGSEQFPDVWGRPVGHPHYGRPPAEVGL